MATETKSLFKQSERLELRLSEQQKQAYQTVANGNISSWAKQQLDRAVLAANSRRPSTVRTTS